MIGQRGEVTLRPYYNFGWKGCKQVYIFRPRACPNLATSFGITENDERMIPRVYGRTIG